MQRSRGKVMAVCICNGIHYSSTTVSTYHKHLSDNRVKSYGYLNLRRYSVSTFELHDILWVSIEHLSQNFCLSEFAWVFLVDKWNRSQIQMTITFNSDLCIRPKIYWDTHKSIGWLGQILTGKSFDSDVGLSPIIYDGARKLIWNNNAIWTTITFNTDVQLIFMIYWDSSYWKLKPIANKNDHNLSSGSLHKARNLLRHPEINKEDSGKFWQVKVLTRMSDWAQ